MASWIKKNTAKFVAILVGAGVLVTIVILVPLLVRAQKTSEDDEGGAVPEAPKFVQFTQQDLALAWCPTSYRARIAGKPWSGLVLTPSDNLQGSAPRFTLKWAASGMVIEWERRPAGTLSAEQVEMEAQSDGSFIDKNGPPCPRTPSQPKFVGFFDRNVTWTWSERTEYRAKFDGYDSWSAWSAPIAQLEFKEGGETSPVIEIANASLGTMKFERRVGTTVTEAQMIPIPGQALRFREDAAGNPTPFFCIVSDPRFWQFVIGSAQQVYSARVTAGKYSLLFLLYSISRAMAQLQQLTGVELGVDRNGRVFCFCNAQTNFPALPDRAPGTAPFRVIPSENNSDPPSRATEPSLNTLLGFEPQFNPVSSTGLVGQRASARPTFATNC